MRKLESGFNLIEVVIAMMVSTTVLAGTATFMLSSNKTLNEVGESDSITIVKSNLQSMLNNEESWRHTFSKSEFDCLNNKSCGDKVAFSVYDANGELYYDSKNPASGFSKSGEQCSGFPSVECPFHFDVSFKSVCDDCSSDQVSVDMDIISNNDARSIASSSSASIVKNIAYCRPGESASCGAAGTQICNATGEAYTSCVEPPSPTVASNTPSPTTGGSGACDDSGLEGGNCENDDQGNVIGHSQHGGR